MTRQVAAMCVAAALAWLGGCEEEKAQPPVPDRFAPTTVPVRAGDAAALEFDSDQQRKGLLAALRGKSLKEATAMLGPPAFVSVWVDSNDPHSARCRIEKVFEKGAAAYRGEHRRIYKVSRPTPGRLLLDINQDRVVAAGFDPGEADEE